MSHIHSIIFLTLILSLGYTTAVENQLDDHSNQEQQIYIISVQNNLKPFEFSNVEDWYKSILNRINPNPSDYYSMLHVYKTVFHGFSARLRPEHAESLRAQVEVITIIPDVIYQLQTTRTPHFLGLDSYHIPFGLLRDSKMGANVVVGVIDTGIDPDHPGFNDDGMDPVPRHFKGVCDGGKDFPPTLCNNKIVGVRRFANAMVKEIEEVSARDDQGHGTHTASTIAGRMSSQNVSFFHYAEGEATGIAPMARLSIYKACWAFGCAGSDVLAAMDKAVEDRVDVISISLGAAARRYTLDPIAVGAYGAFQKGVIVSAAAGNGGPTPGSLSNTAPWLITVGASTIDRTFPADVILDNGEVLSGSSLYTGEPLPKDKTFPFIHFPSNYSMGHCLPGSLDDVDVKGKIVICSPGQSNRVDKGVVVSKAGGVGVIVALNNPLISENDTQKSDPFFMIPGVTIPFGATEKLLNDLNKKIVKEGTILIRGTKIGEKPAPVVASFSSRGPNSVSKYILKPDVIGPGVDILAGWPNTVPPSTAEDDHRVTQYNILSGTSMSCPHVSGLAALLKGAHLDWEPSLIKSALMTTAYFGYHEATKIIKQNNSQQDPPHVSYWSTGAGHVYPEKANTPGLVYNVTENDYIKHLCASGYNASEIKVLIKRPVKCDEESKVNEWDLNYPALVVPSDCEGKVFVKTLTSLESNASIYTVKVSSPKGFNVTVDPLELSFKKKGDKQSYSVTISALKEEDQGFVINEQATSSISWTDGKHNVTIPLVIV